MESSRFSIRNVPAERTIYMRMEGYFEEPGMRAFTQAAIRDVESYGGQPHLVLADMREMEVVGDGAARVLGEFIGDARQKGVVCCAHLSSSIVQRLQAARVAREYTVGDDVTVNVVSLEEALVVLAEMRQRLGWVKSLASVARLSTPAAPF